MEILKQDRNSPIPVEKQVAILYATVHGYLKDIAVKDIAAYESALYQYLDENVTAGGVMEAIRTTGDMEAGYRTADERCARRIHGRLYQKCRIITKYAKGVLPVAGSMKEIKLRIKAWKAPCRLPKPWSW